ncbi:hypothetical protein [Pseudomonas typographi]|uniref:Uncharacterized protein n=1 Tax=Pseudomonas typographi TaxID=2715964 RepID=A0ABR7YVG2_9PSED|nr:hypothetical protein [Pseudomonas typographi]MBD1552141.1 hypothetical protein [Pseudomonas typographi]MBD1585113.1 hypothetical protein [Pseudomonas typographi]MBD1597160.1 hypothetical protein [Pseudomonas typographi]
MNTPHSPHTLQVSLRECRLVLERLMQVIGTPPGMVPALRDCALYSAALELGGFNALQQHLHMLENSAAAPLTQDHPHGVIDCTGQHAWRVADSLLDLLADDFQCHGSARLIVTNVQAPDELRVIQALGERYGLHVTVSTTGQGIALEAQPRAAIAPATLQRVRAQGLSVDEGLWWTLFNRANEALAPDSFESRRHAGSIMVDAEGRLVGRPDEDETDLSLLMAGVAAGTTAPTH